MLTKEYFDTDIHNLCELKSLWKYLPTGETVHVYHNIKACSPEHYVNETALRITSSDCVCL
jgi:hypothetical protein